MTASFIIFASATLIIHPTFDSMKSKLLASSDKELKKSDGGGGGAAVAAAANGLVSVEVVTAV